MSDGHQKVNKEEWNPQEERLRRDNEKKKKKKKTRKRTKGINGKENTNSKNKTIRFLK